MTKYSVVLAAALLAPASIPAVAAGAEHHVNAALIPVEGSGVTGFVSLTALPKGGTDIVVVAKGLTPGTAYLSLYYDNDECDLEPYSEDDVIGNYMGRPGGLATTESKAADDLDEINSVSVRDSDFNLLACAKVHDAPEESLRVSPVTKTVSARRARW